MSPFLADMLVAICAAFLAGALGVGGGIWLARRNRRAEERVRFLLQAYSDIEYGCNRENIPNKNEFERALASVWLLGNPKQLELTEKFMDQFSTASGADTSDLLLELRSSLRNELGLERMAKRHRFLRLARHENESP